MPVSVNATRRSGFSRTSRGLTRFVGSLRFVLILAAFVGYYVAGVPGVLAGTFAVFAIPVVLAAGSAGIVQRLNRYVRFRAFARFAGAGAVGLLAVTLSVSPRRSVASLWLGCICSDAAAPIIG